jgi:hypothetical protein
MHKKEYWAACSFFTTLLPFYCIILLNWVELVKPEAILPVFELLAWLFDFPTGLLCIMAFVPPHLHPPNKHIPYDLSPGFK